MLSDWSVACWIVIGPEYVWLYVETSHAGIAGSGWYVNGADTYVEVAGLMPWLTAAASTNVLKVEPACRRAWATRLNWFFTRPG